jgi:hypothetical protein
MMIWKIKLINFTVEKAPYPRIIYIKIINEITQKNI